jgi:SAM-dependent methyltransferase
MHKRVGVLVLAHNAAGGLVGTLDRIPASFRDRIDELIVLDDASTDDTFPRAAAWARRNHFVRTTVLRHTKHLGYGGNRKAGYRLAIEHSLDIVVLLTGDERYAPESLPILVRPLLDGTADATFGVRARDEPDARDEDWLTKACDKTLTWAGTRALAAAGQESDADARDANARQAFGGLRSGHRAYSVAALRGIPFEANSDGPDFDTQILVQLAHKGKRVVEVELPVDAGPSRAGGPRYALDVARDLYEYRRAMLGFGTSDWVPAPTDPAFKQGRGTSHDALLAELSKLSAGRVLDLGCGSGRLAQQARELGHRVVGVDRTEIDGVRDRMNLFVRADLDAGIPQEARVAAGYDVVVAADVLQHLVHPERLLREIRGVLRPGGQVLVCVPNAVHWYARLRFASGRFDYDRRGLLDIDHLRFFTRRSLRRLIERTGYDVLDEQVGGLPWRGQQALARLAPNLFAYQLIIRLTPHHEDTIAAPNLADEVFDAHHGSVPRQQERRHQDA